MTNQTFDFEAITDEELKIASGGKGGRGGRGRSHHSGHRKQRSGGSFATDLGREFALGGANEAGVLAVDHFHDAITGDNA